jgi:hypothetical protein
MKPYPGNIGIQNVAMRNTVTAATVVSGVIPAELRLAISLSKRNHTYVRNGGSSTATLAVSFRPKTGFR